MVCWTPVTEAFTFISLLVLCKEAKNGLTFFKGCKKDIYAIEIKCDLRNPKYLLSGPL